MTLLDDLERLHAEANAGGVAPLTAWRNGAAKELLRDTMLANAPRLLAMLRAAEGMRRQIVEQVSNAKAACEYGHQHRQCAAFTSRKKRCPDCPLDDAADLEMILSAYDAAKGE